MHIAKGIFLNGSIRQVDRIAFHIEPWESIRPRYAHITVTPTGTSSLSLGSRESESQEMPMSPGGISRFTLIANSLVDRNRVRQQPETDAG
jgi:hypothetical protein